MTVTAARVGLAAERQEVLPALLVVLDGLHVCVVVAATVASCNALHLSEVAGRPTDWSTLAIGGPYRTYCGLGQR